MLTPETRKKSTSPQRRTRESGRDRLLESAIALFSERGFDQVSTKEVAAASGVTIGSLYHHFESKEAVYCAALERAIEAVTPAPVELAVALSPEKGLKMLIAWFSEVLISQPLLRQELLDPHLDRPLKDIPTFRVSLFVFEKHLNEVNADYDTDFAIALIVSLCFGLTSLKGLQPSLETQSVGGEEVADMICKVVFPHKI